MTGQKNVNKFTVVGLSIGIALSSMNISPGITLSEESECQRVRKF